MTALKAGDSWRPLVVFDLDDTLVDYDHAILSGLSAFAAERGVGEEGLTFLLEIDRLPLTVEETWSKIRTRFDFGEDASVLAERFQASLPALCRPYPGVVESLTALRSAGWTTALLTNGLDHEQRAKLDGGLLTLFDAVQICDPAGPRKPQPDVFREVAGAAGAEVSGAWMVGDSLASDVAGGAAAGMVTVWVSHGRSIPDDVSVRPDHIVPSVHEAFDLLLGVEQTYAECRRGSEVE